MLSLFLVLALLLAIFASLSVFVRATIFTLVFEHASVTTLAPFKTIEVMAHLILLVGLRTVRSSP